MASKARDTYVSKTINWIKLKSCVLMSSFNTGALAQILDLMLNDKLTLKAKLCLNDKQNLVAHEISHQQFDKLHGLQSTILEHVGTAPGFLQLMEEVKINK